MSTKMNDKVEASEKKTALVNKYAELAKKLGAHPTYAQLQEKGITRDMVKHHFTSKEILMEIAKEICPDSFAGMIDEDLYNPTNFKKVTKELVKFNRFFVTTAVPLCPINKNALKSAKTYCKLNKAALLVVVSNNDLTDIDEALVNDPDVFIIWDDVALNNNIHISTIKVDPKAVDPITGMDRVSQKDGSMIFASPKQRLKTIPNVNFKMPHCLMTTGAITLPKYNHKQKDKYSKTRRDLLAFHDHVMGGLVIEIGNKEEFHFRQVQFEKGGNFVDLGVYYQENNVSILPPKALVLGDYHSIDKDPIADAAYRQLVKNIPVDVVVMHDAFDGKSISHHDQNRQIYRAMLFEKNKLSLEGELKVLAQDLNEWAELTKEVVMVSSNHNDFLPRYLEDGRWTREPHNFKMAALLTAAKVMEKDPLVEGLALTGLKAQNVRWLDQGESYKIARIELGDHGDRGGNGARGSLMAMEKSYGNSVTGHSHSPEILRGAWQVGTTSKLQLDYNKGGSSSWFHTACLVYPNGSRQLINVVNGRCHIPQEVTMKKAAKKN